MNRRPAVALLLVVVGLLGWGVAVGSIVPTGFINDTGSGDTDVALYKSIVRAMDGGEGYYAAVAQLQPAAGFPTSPAPAVREPALALLLSGLGPALSFLLLVLMAGAAVVLLLPVIEQWSRSRWEWYGGLLLLVAVLAELVVPTNVWIHDVWAGVLVLLAVATAARRWWPATVVAMTLATCVREIVVVAMVGLLVHAAVHRRWREVAAWCGAGAVTGAVYLVHVIEVGRHVPADAGPGWGSVLGWPFVVNAAWFSTPLNHLPILVAAVALPLVVLGLLPMWKVCPELVVVVGCLAVFGAVAGRDNTLYWGVVWAAPLAVAAAFAPRGVAGLVRAARPARS